MCGLASLVTLWSEGLETLRTKINMDAGRHPLHPSGSLEIVKKENITLEYWLK